VGLTAVAVGVTVWSGIDALNNPGQSAVKRDCASLREACPEYQQGIDAQRRTNVLLAVTGTIGVATAVIGLFFTDWQRSEHAPGGAAAAAERARLRIEPSVTLGSLTGAALKGTF
jgi:hypothetical protein